MQKNRDKTVRLQAAREMAFKPFSILTSAIMAFLGILSLLDYGPPYGFVIIGLSIIVAANVIVFEKTKNLVLAGSVLALSIGTLSLYAYYFDVVDSVGNFWLIIFPIPTMLLLGRKLGTLFIIVYTAAFLPGILLPAPVGVIYDSRFVIYVMLAINVVTLLMFVYEQIINNSLKLSQAHTQRLDETTSHLKDEILQREQVEYKMRIVLEDLANKNQKLEEVTRIDEATISSIGEAVLIVNQHSVITRANPSAGRILGVNQEQLIKHKLSKVLAFHSPSDDKLENRFSEQDIVIGRSIQHRSIVEDTYKVVRSDSSTLYAQMTASPLVVGGTVFGAVVVIRDVTQEVNVDQAKTEFVSIASHQLRTPLSTINWYLEMVLAGDFGEINDEQREFISEAYDAGKRMGHLIDSLLNVSRIDVGVFAVDPQPTDLKKVIDDVVADLTAKITKKKLDLKIDIDASLGKPKYDQRIMNIIFQNLISNAVKYTPNNGQVKVKVAAKDRMVAIEVKDTGYGIPKHQQEKIFSKMFRAENAVEREPDGTGLGLYIIKSVVEEVGGTIRFESEENKGTTFYVELPKEGMKAKKGSRELTEGAGV